MRRLLLAALLATVIGGCGAAAEKAGAAATAPSDLPTVESLLALLDDKLKDVRGLSADVQATMPDGPLSGTLKCLAPDFVRMELAATKKGKDGREQVADSVKMVIANKVLYLESCGTKTDGATKAVRMDLPELEKVTREMADTLGLCGPPQQPLGTVPNYSFINYLKAQQEAGSAIKVLKAEPDLVTVEVRVKGAPKAGREEVTISTVDGFLRSKKTFEGRKLTQELVLSNIKARNDLQAADFTYAPPAGVEVDDLVQMMRQMMQTLKGAKAGPNGNGPAPGSGK